MVWHSEETKAMGFQIITCLSMCIFLYVFQMHLWPLFKIAVKTWQVLVITEHFGLLSLSCLFYIHYLQYQSRKKYKNTFFFF